MVTALIIAGISFADTTPALAEPVAAPFQSRPKPPPPPPDPLHLFSKKPHRTRVVRRTRVRTRSTIHIKLPPHPPAPPRP